MSFSPENNLVFAAASIAAVIAESRSDEDIEILANLFTAIGDNLNLIASQREKSGKQ